jgi:CPA2 family monovalent cation:H+ antiporter-2
MLHLPSLIQDLGIILAAAAFVSLIFKKLKQPVVLGYIIAGFFVSPHITFLPTVQDHESIKIWAEIGVIFLLFGLGLEFSFKKLIAVGKPASVTAFTKVLAMIGVGYGLGMVLGWSKMDSLFLGSLLSISSTMIIVRAFDELNLKGRSFASLALGVLIIEDLVAILILVLLSTVVVTQTLSGSEMMISTAKLAFFLVLWFVIGIYILPTALKKMRNLLNDETMLVIAIGLCFLMVIFATAVGFSAALGAFVMGSILAETREGKRVEHLIEPVKNLFAAVFFVSVGMMIDPHVLVEHFWVILLISFVIIVTKVFGTVMGALLAGQNLKNSVQSGMSLAQIGEFSFIIATLGISLKVTSDFLYPIAVAVSALTTFTTPYLIKNSERFYLYLEAHLPARFLNGLQNYQNRVNRQSEHRIFKTLWETYGIKLVLNLVVVIAVFIVVRRYFHPFLENYFADGVALRITSGLIALVLSSPFLVGMFSGGKAQKRPTHKLGTLYRRIEHRFLSNLEDQKQNTAPEKTLPELAPWDAALIQFKLAPESNFVGKTLSDCMIREQFGVTIALIERGNKKIVTPGRGDLLLPFDILYLIGTDEQLAKIQPVLQPPIDENHAELEKFDHIGLESIRLGADSEYLGKTIRNCGLREVISGLIVGIERNGKRMLNPDSSEELKAQDLLWVVGDRKKIRAMTTQSVKT